MYRTATTLPPPRSRRPGHSTRVVPQPAQPLRLSAGDGPTSTHVFCGLGGDTEGFKEAGFVPRLALNHSPVAVATHRANFPDCEHDTADINNYDMRRLVKTDVLVGSPICKEATPAGGNCTPKTQLELGETDDYTPAATWERTRATAYDLLRAAEVHHYDAVLWENVVDFATRWNLFGWWLKAWEVLGYVPQVVSANAAHLGGGPDSKNPRARQSRDRILGVMVRKGIKAPDLRVRPECICADCGPVIGIQRWRPGRKARAREIGRYGVQYDFVCPNRSCGHRIVTPVTDSVSGVVDWDLPGQRIGDGKPKRKTFTPYPESTLALVQEALDRYPRTRHLAEPDRSQHLIVHIGRDSAPRLTSDTLTTVACKPHHALIRPAPRIEDCTLRMLQPSETARVQRFPKTYTLTGTVKEQYIQVGNAVPVNAAHWLGERLLPSLS